MNSNLPFYDVVVVGAGLAGLSCASNLQRQGLQVLVLEKSRGLGGRIATRRLHDTCVDHGLPYLQAQGQLSRQIIAELTAANLIQPWQERAVPTYVAPEGMTAIAKYLASNLAIWRESRVTAIVPNPEKTWLITLETGQQLTAKTLVVAIPAPQALALLEPLVNFAPELIQQLRGVEFAPCIVVMAGYSTTTTEKINPLAELFCQDSRLAWVSQESSKRKNTQQTVFLLRSTSQFAESYLETPDLQSAAQELLETATQILTTELTQPDWQQVHRWRYAFPRQSVPQAYLATEQPLPLICCGDWCGGNLVESALSSGLATAQKVLNLV